MIELVYRICNKMKIFLYKLVNWKTLKLVKLHGIPKLLFRENIILKENISINSNVFIHGAGGVTIGEDSILSYGVTILSTGLENENWKDIPEGKNTHKHINKQVIIGSNVWIGANSTILPGVTIGNDIIIAAGAVVTKDLQDSEWIYGGVPAKKIKKI